MWAGFVLNFSVIQKYIRDFDWRSLKKLTNPAAFDDLNRFLEKLPRHTGNTMLIIAGVAWAGAAAAGLYTAVQLQQLTKLRADLKMAEAVKPKVPEIKDVPIETAEIQTFMEKIKETYGGLTFTLNGSSLQISATATASFGQFREAIGHVQNGGSGWRVALADLCVGRECEREPLSATLKINKVSVN